jgi:hypothetical protein
MAVLAAINKILDIKLVQWALLALVSALFGATLFFGLRLKLANIQVSFLEADNAKKDGLVVQQNASIAMWKREGELAAAKVKGAMEAAVKIARDYDAKIAELRAKPIREDCCGAIEDAKNIILGVK